MKIQTRKMEDNFKPSDEVSWHNGNDNVSFLTHGDFRQLQGKLEDAQANMARLQEIIEGVKTGEVTKETVEEVLEHMMGGDKEGYCSQCHEHSSAEPAIDLEYYGGCCGQGVVGYDDHPY